MIYHLDKNAITDLVRHHVNLRPRVLQLLATDRIRMSTIVRGEVLHEIGRLNPGKKRAGLEREIEEIFAAIPSESLDDRMADFYAQIKVVRQRKGFPMDENDLWIAGTAKVFNAVLVTRDHDFQQVDGLVIEDWTQ